MKALEPVTEADARVALDQYGDVLSRFRSVQGMGVGEQMKAEKPTGQFAVKIYVKKKLLITRCDPKDILPRSLRIITSSGNCKDVAVDVVEIGSKLSFETDR